MLRVLKNKSLIPIFIFYFTGQIASGMLGAINVLFALDLGATNIELGLIASTSGLISMCIQIPFGILSDRLGRKPMLFITQLLILLADIVRSLANQPWHLVIASLFGAFRHEMMPVTASLVYDLSEPSASPDSLSMLYFFSSLGLFIGPNAASLLLLFIPKRSLYVLSSLIRLAILALLFFGIKEVRTRTERGSLKSSYKSNVARLLKKTNMLVAIQARLGYSFFQSAYGTYMPVLARQELKLPDTLIASLSIFQAIGRTGLRLFLGRLIHKLTAKKLFVLALCMCGASGLLIFFANNFYHLLLLNFLFGLSLGVDAPLSTLLVSDSSTKAERGFGNSILFTVVAVGTSTPLMTAPIADGWGVAFVFPFVAILPITSALITAWFMKPLSTEQEHTG